MDERCYNYNYRDRAISTHAYVRVVEIFLLSGEAVQQAVAT
jgi:hypothetical protein